MSERDMMRRYTFKLYPTVVQASALDAQRRMHALLWNALLQMREDRWRRQSQAAKEDRRGLSYYDQCKDLTALRQAMPEWAALSSDAMVRTAQLLDEAFKAFFRRLKAGEAEAGYPRYKSVARHGTIPFRKMGSGWKLTHVSACNWRLYAKGVPGLIKARGKFPLEPKDYRNAEIIQRDGAWWLSICVTMPARRCAGHERIKIRFDLIDEFARVERAEGRSPACSKERITPNSQRDSRPPGSEPLETGADEREVATALAASQGSEPLETGADERTGKTTLSADGGSEPLETGADERLRAIRRSPWGSEPLGTGGDDVQKMAARCYALCLKADAIKASRDIRFPRKPFTRPSCRWRRETKRAAKLTTKAARIRKHSLHMWSTSIVRRAADITLIMPAVKEATKTPRGHEKEHGANVAAVSNLNRHILNFSPALAAQLLRYKADEAQIRCDVAIDEAPKVAVGRDLVTAGKTIRRARRALRKEAA